MKIRLLTIVFSGVCLLTSCKQAQTQASEDGLRGAVQSEDKLPPLPRAEISMSSIIDMGVFTKEDIKKSTLVSLTNIGTDTLVIVGAQPECECTTATVIDSIVPPHGTGRMQVSLDLKGYPADTIYKDISIVSNHLEGKVLTFRLMGVIQ